MRKAEGYISRQEYIERVLEAGRRKKTALITGVRGSGKSCLLKLVREELRLACIPAARIITITRENFSKFEDIADMLPPDAGYSGPKVYFLIDDIQDVRDWPELLKTLKRKYNCIIYAVYSNPLKELLKSNLWLSENCIEIEIFPLSLNEFISFHGYQLYKKPASEANIMSKRISDRYIIYDNEGLKIREELFLKRYFEYGGFPQIPCVSHNSPEIKTVYEGIFSSIVLFDIINRKEKRQFSDPELLEIVAKTLSASICENISDTQLTNRLNDLGGTSFAIQTIQSYIKAFENAKVFYPIKRYDIRNCKELSTLGKRYIVDSGLKNYITGWRNAKQDATSEHSEIAKYNRALENNVYFELCRRGYKVCNGMLRNHNITFIAIKGDEKEYYQIIGIGDDKELEAALKSLRAIRDNFEKTVILNKWGDNVTEDGIRLVNTLAFLLGE